MKKIKKKEIKRISLLVILTFLIIISNLPRNFDTTTLSNNDKSNNLLYNDEIDVPQTSEIKKMENYINGTGVDQTVRLFMRNESQSLNNEDYFKIPPPTPGANLSSADLYFNFDNNYTTDYILKNIFIKKQLHILMFIMGQNFLTVLMS